MWLDACTEHSAITQRRNDEEKRRTQKASAIAYFRLLMCTVAKAAATTAAVSSSLLARIFKNELRYTHMQTHYSLLIAQDKWYRNLVLYALHNFIQFITLCRKDYVHFQLLQWLDIFPPRKKKKAVYFVLHLDPTSAALSIPIDLNLFVSSSPAALYVCRSKFLVFSKVNEIAWGRHTHNWFPSISVCSLNGIKPYDFPWIISLNWCEQ